MLELLLASTCFMQNPDGSLLKLPFCGRSNSTTIQQQSPSKPPSRSPEIQAPSQQIKKDFIPRLTQEKYIRLRQYVVDNNPLDDKLSPANRNGFNGILGFSGKLVSSNSGAEAWEWTEFDNSRRIEGVFAKNGQLMRWKGEGF